MPESTLKSFLELRRVDTETLVVFNGLPRHAGQAAALNTTVEMRCVILLQCSAETVQARIAADVGGDRAHRNDDAADDILNKLAIFQQRTVPLVDHYRLRLVPVIQLDVGATTLAEELWRALSATLPATRIIDEHH